MLDGVVAAFRRPLGKGTNPTPSRAPPAVVCQRPVKPRCWTAIAIISALVVIATIALVIAMVMRLYMIKTKQFQLT